MKKINQFLCLVATLCPLFLISPVLAEAQYAVIGKAYNRAKPQQLCYSEFYTLISGDKVKVTYKDPEGRLIADKTLDFSTGRLTPSFILTDYRSHMSKGAEVKQKNIVLLRRDKNHTNTVRKTMTQKPDQVVNAGFVNLITHYWSDLLKGKRQTFYFAFAGHLKNIKLNMSAVEGRDTPIYNAEHHWQYFKMALSNPLLAMFVDPVYLAFDRQKRLVRYYGRSNLSDAKGQDQDVLIKYYY